MPPHYHIFALADRDDKPGSKPTLIAIQTASGLLPQPPTTDAVPKVDDSVPAFGIMRYHEGDVTWTQKIDVPKNAPRGRLSNRRPDRLPGLRSRPRRRHLRNAAVDPLRHDA